MSRLPGAKKLIAEAKFIDILILYVDFYCFFQHIFYIDF